MNVKSLKIIILLSLSFSLVSCDNNNIITNSSIDNTPASHDETILEENDLSEEEASLEQEDYEGEADSIDKQDGEDSDVDWGDPL